MLLKLQFPNLIQNFRRWYLFWFIQLKWRGRYCQLAWQEFRYHYGKMLKDPTHEWDFEQWEWEQYKDQSLTELYADLLGLNIDQ